MTLRWEMYGQYGTLGLHFFKLFSLFLIQADTLEVLSDLREVRQHMDMTAIDRRNKLLLDKDKMVTQLIDITDKVRAACIVLWLLLFPLFFSFLNTGLDFCWLMNALASLW